MKRIFYFLIGLIAWLSMLCSIAAKRARNINEMMRGQKDRALELQTVAEITQFSDHKPLSLAMEEIERGDLSFVKQDPPPNVPEQ